MPITIQKAKEIGDKKLNFGATRDYSFRGEILKILVSKKQAYSAPEIAGTPEFKAIVAKDKNINAKKLRQALNNLKSEKKIKRSVENNIGYYYVDTK